MGILRSSGGFSVTGICLNVFVHHGYSYSQTDQNRGLPAHFGARPGKTAGGEPVVQVAAKGGEGSLVQGEHGA
ncbi:hypothetical protein [Phocaeicola dorei]|uniref:hypothetical protein n=1 Tax=Phocaeicola dorei TaxID=357276 RepID=UPI0020331B29|nr:hypothetical protein [Phocaeicola dorei]